jgi:hypothetical protein
MEVSLPWNNGVMDELGGGQLVAVLLIFSGDAVLWLMFTTISFQNIQ